MAKRAAAQCTLHRRCSKHDTPPQEGGEGVTRANAPCRAAFVAMVRRIRRGNFRGDRGAAPLSQRRHASAPESAQCAGFACSQTPRARYVSSPAPGSEASMVCARDKNGAHYAILCIGSDAGRRGATRARRNEAECESCAGICAFSGALQAPRRAIAEVARSRGGGLAGAGPSDGVDLSDNVC